MKIIKTAIPTLSLFLLSGCISNPEEINKKDEEIISEALLRDINYDGEFSIEEIDVQGRGIGSSSTKYVTVKLNENDVILDYALNLNSFGRTTKETKAISMFEDMIGDKMIHEEFELSENGYAAFHTYTYDRNVFYQKTALEQYEMLLNGTDYTLEKFLEESKGVDEIDIYVEDDGILSASKTKELVQYIRNNSQLTDFSVIVVDGDLMLEVEKLTDNINISFEDLIFENRELEKTEEGLITYMNKYETPYQELEKGVLQSEYVGPIYYIKAIDQNTGENYSTWAEQNITDTSFRSVGSNTSKYMNRLGEVLHEKLNQKLNFEDLGILTIVSEDGFGLRKVAGLSKNEIEEKFDVISTEYTRSIQIAFFLEKPMNETDKQRLSEVLYEASKSMPGMRDGYLIIYIDDEDLKKEYFNNFYINKMKDKVNKVQNYEYLWIPYGTQYDDNLEQPRSKEELAKEL